MIAGVIVASLGAAWCCVAAVGVVRLPDVFSRLHAATKATTLGLTLVLVGAAIISPSPGVAGKLALAIILQLVTAPVAAHVVGRAAYRAELPSELVVDELAEDAREAE